MIQNLAEKFLGLPVRWQVFWAVYFGFLAWFFLQIIALVIIRRMERTIAADRETVKKAVVKAIVEAIRKKQEGGADGRP